MSQSATKRTHPCSLDYLLVLIDLLSYRFILLSEPQRVKSRPLRGSLLKKEMIASRHRKQAGSAFLDIIFSVFLLWIVYSIAYSARDDRSYLHHRVIENLFLVPNKLPHFEKVNIEDPS